jgi:hypothetical protein
MRSGITSIVFVLFAGVLLTASSVVAQTISVNDTNGPRIGGSISYGGHGVDGEIAIDSRTFWNDVQFRAVIGQGRWVGVNATVPPAGSDPTVTRAGVSMIKNGPFDPYAPVRIFGGGGVAAFVPRNVALGTVVGVHILAGIEVVGDRWSFGPELQIDSPLRNHYRLPAAQPGTYLSPTARIGFFARRRL